MGSFKYLEIHNIMYEREGHIIDREVALRQVPQLLQKERNEDVIKDRVVYQERDGEMKELKPRLCTCGCGQEVRIGTRYEKYVRPARFISGHNRRGFSPWNKKSKIEKICLTCKNIFYVPPCREKSAKYCSHPCYAVSLKGKPTWCKGTKGLLKPNRSSFKKGNIPWTKDKKGIHLAPQTEFKNGNIPWNKDKKGIHLSPQTEFKKGIKNPNKGKTFEEIYGYEKAQLIKKKYIEKRIKQVFPLRDTKPERILQEVFKKEGIKFETHKSIMGQPDIFIEPNICIFADGCYWHGCEQCYNRNKMSNWIKSKKVIDSYVTQKLQNMGYIVFRFWEHDIKNNLDICINKINGRLK